MELMKITDRNSSKSVGKCSLKSSINSFSSTEPPPSRSIFEKNLGERGERKYTQGGGRSGQGWTQGHKRRGTGMLCCPPFVLLVGPFTFLVTKRFPGPAQCSKESTSRRLRPLWVTEGSQVCDEQSNDGAPHQCCRSQDEQLWTAYCGSNLLAQLEQLRSLNVARPEFFAVQC